MLDFNEDSEYEYNLEWATPLEHNLVWETPTPITDVTRDYYSGVDHDDGLPANLWVGLTGFAGSGKSTVADYLVHAYGFTVISIANPLKEMAYAIDPIIDTSNGRSLKEIVDTSGWDGAKRNYTEVRRFLQRLGNEGVRGTFGEHAWVDIAHQKAWENGGRVVFPDVRFQSDVDMVEAHSHSAVLRVERPALANDFRHASETALLDVPFYRVNNSGGFGDLETSIEETLYAIGAFL